ncbi:hypothetical protein Hanom_Chr13g01240421 [Helianthus anomalus]
MFLFVPLECVGIIVIGNPGPIGTDGIVTTHTIVFKQPTTLTVFHDGLNEKQICKR